MITLAQLVAAGIGPTSARRFVDPLNRALERFRIEARPQQAAFIAQASHETDGFTKFEENLYYRSPERVLRMFSAVRDLEHASKLCRNPRGLANAVYANRLGNGDEASGEGWLYRGRGAFHLTGRANYAIAGDALGRPYKTQPELVAEPLDAFMTAGWYWVERGLHKLSSIDDITRKINPAMAGADDRRQRFDETARALA